MMNARKMTWFIRLTWFIIKLLLDVVKGLRILSENPPETHAEIRLLLPNFLNH